MVCNIIGSPLQPAVYMSRWHFAYAFGANGSARSASGFDNGKALNEVYVHQHFLICLYSIFLFLALCFYGFIVLGMG